MRLRTLIGLVCHAGVAVHAFLALDAYAQTGRAAGNWHCSCPGGPREVPNSINSGPPDCRKVCFPGSGGGSGGSSGGFTPLQQMQLNMAGQAGALLGNAIREAIFGSPQQAANRAAQEAAERAQAEARRAEQQRALEEEERRQQAIRDRLLAGLRSVGPSQALGIRSVDSGPALQFRLDETLAPRLSEVPESSAMAQLTRAVYYSVQAAHAGSDEDAAVLADAAFNATIGVPVDLPVPPDTQTVSIDDADMRGLQDARGQYQRASAEAQAALAAEAEAEQQRAVAQLVLERARAGLVAGERAFMRSPSPDRKPRIVRAQRIVREAEELLARQEKNVAEARSKVTKAEPVVDEAARKALEQKLRLQRIARAAGAFQSGILEGSLCMPSNADQYCANLQEQQAACIQNYHGGFRIGERAKEAKLRQAHAIGAAARQSNNSLAGFEHPRSAGPCRTRWLQSFYGGFKGFPFNMAGR
jgi:hypothetical protein